MGVYRNLHQSLTDYVEHLVRAAEEKRRQESTPAVLKQTPPSRTSLAIRVLNERDLRAVGLLENSERAELSYSEERLAVRVEVSSGGYVVECFITEQELESCKEPMRVLVNTIIEADKFLRGVKRLG